MIALGLSALLIYPSLLSADTNPDGTTDTWANWSRRLDHAFQGISLIKVPGRAMGILVPQDIRPDLLPMSAMGYSTLSPQSLRTVIFLLPAPASLQIDGLVMPSLDTLSTSIGNFSVDVLLSSQFRDERIGIRIDNAPFAPFLHPLLENQLAILRYTLKGRTSRLKILPIYIRLSNLEEQVKDIAPTLADIIRDNGMATEITIVMAADFSQGLSEEKLIPNDSAYLTAVRNMDVDALIDLTDASQQPESLVRIPNAAPVALGLLTLKFLGGDHSQILAYAHSGQLTLTKSGQSLVSYAAAAVPSGPPLPLKIPHVRRDKHEEIFDEMFRSDLLAVARQACAAIMDPTAAKPPALVDPDAGRPWPVYVSLFNPEGALGGQAGSHFPVGPLEESLKKFAFQAVREARGKGLTKDNFKNWTVEVSIPHGFNKLNRPEDLIPFLNGIIVEHQHKKFAFHPEAWRTYPDPHQLLGSISFNVGLSPWAYATRRARIESFRVLAFNEKEPYQTFTTTKKRRRQKQTTEEEEEGGADSPGGTFFPF